MPNIEKAQAKSCLLELLAQYPVLHLPRSLCRCHSQEQAGVSHLTSVYKHTPEGVKNSLTSYILWS